MTIAARSVAPLAFLLSVLGTGVASARHPTQPSLLMRYTFAPDVETLIYDDGLVVDHEALITANAAPQLVITRCQAAPAAVARLKFRLAAAHIDTASPPACLVLFPFHVNAFTGVITWFGQHQNRLSFGSPPNLPLCDTSDPPYRIADAFGTFLFQTLGRTCSETITAP
jgi:hypothetical protein